MKKMIAFFLSILVMIFVISYLGKYIGSNNGYSYTFKLQFLNEWDY